MKKTIALIIAITLLQACTAARPDLKSPCVGAEGSPCDHRPANDWWMKG